MKSYTSQKGPLFLLPMLQRLAIASCLSLLLLDLAVSAGHSTTSLRIASGKTFRIMSYNIHVGVGMDKKLDLQRIADIIIQQHPDLVGLQEVDRGVMRTEGKDEIAELAKLTRMDYAFAHNLDFQGGQYGVAILSRYLIQNIDHQKYRNTREEERRGMIRVVVEVENRSINFVTTHLDYQFPDGRIFETQQLLNFLEGIKGSLIVAGDFNEEPVAGAYRLMLAQFVDAWTGSDAKAAGFSYPADRPVKRIDYIFCRTADISRVKKAWVVNTLASDHLPVMAEVEIR